jgi:two-component system OmpR family sensor kinase
LALYTALVLLIIGAISYYYYESQRTLMLSDKRALLTGYAYEQIKRLKALHQAFPQKRTYPRDERFTSAIYDIEYYKIFSLNEEEPQNFFNEIETVNGKIHYIKDLDVFYLGARYLVLEIDDDGAWRQEALQRIALYATGSFLLLIILGIYLARLFVAPMRNAILLLDRFIADTTHELNTPLSTILTNIELMEFETLSERNRKKLERIAAAAKSVSVLYRDLTYMVLERARKVRIEPLQADRLVRERIRYFETLAQQKRVGFELTLHRVCVFADKKDMERLTDNLLSNAIKYNRRGGKVRVELTSHMLRVSDTGIGIDETRLPLLFDRYMRFSRQEGGFGVGLSIVKDIAERYGWNIDVASVKGEGTVFSVYWKKEDICDA